MTSSVIYSFLRDLQLLRGLQLLLDLLFSHDLVYIFFRNPSERFFVAWALFVAKALFCGLGRISLTIADSRGPRTGPSCLLGDPELNPILAQIVLRACSGPLRPAQVLLRAAHPRLRLKRPLVRSEAETGTGEKKTYVRLLGSSRDYYRKILSSECPNFTRIKIIMNFVMRS